jgi:DNA-directed RNA polymerase subunit omega
VPRSLNNEHTTMNAELQKKALEKVGNPNTLINLVSRRVRQLNAGSGGMSRPLIADAGTLGAGDIALREIIEEKIGWDPAEEVVAETTAPKKRKARR